MAEREAGGIRIRAVDPIANTWRSLPLLAGEPTRRGILSLPNGWLVLATTTLAGGVFTSTVALWDGATWQTLGNFDGGVGSLAAMPNGDIVAAGEFAHVNATTANNIASWNGTSWSPLGSGVDAPAYSLAIDIIGDLIAGGVFATAGGVPTGGIARWNGTAWSAIDPSLPYAYDVAVAPNGDVYASTGGSVRRVLPSGSITLGTFSHNAWAIAFDSTGSLLVGGEFHTVTAGVSLPVERIARWNGQAWSALPPARVECVNWLAALPTGDIAVGGSFDSANFDSGLRRWTGTAWGVFGRGVDGPIGSVLAEPDGTFVVAGLFRFAGGVEVGGLARWDGQAFAPIGGASNGVVSALARAPNGDLLVAGAFTAIGGVVAHKVARWNGAFWTPIPGLGTIGAARQLAVLPNGDIVVGGYVLLPGVPSTVSLARWDGVAWSQLGSPDWRVYALAVTASGTLVGSWVDYVVQRTEVRSWNGTGWTLLGATNVGLLTCLLPLANGDLLAGGGGIALGGLPPTQVARWNGISWSTVGPAQSGHAGSLCELPNGDVVHAANSLSVVPDPVLQRWDGMTWTPLGPTIIGHGGPVVVASDGTIVVGGFLVGTEAGSGALATFQPTCPATAVAYGSGCAGSAGVPDLTAETRAWLGSTFTARCTNVPANALVVAACGFGALQVPLSLVTPLALPGCDGLVTPNWLATVAPIGGVARSHLAIPAASALIGASFFHQHLPVEISMTHAITAITASNALELRIGTL